MQSLESASFNTRKVLFIFLGILVLRAIVALTIGFVDDDAYHWTWTQQLDWSYFDHPGMIAWLEALTTGIFGDTRLGVRLPSFLCFSFVVYFTWKFARELFDSWAATFTAALILFTPLWGVGGYVSSPEPPFIVLWVLAAWVFWQGVREDDKRWSVKKTWLWLGVLMGVGFNTKFPMVLIAPGFGLYLLMTPQRRKDLLTPWPWVGVVIATVLLAPVIYWNLKYDWPSFKFQFHDRHQGESFSFNRWLGYIGAQVGLLTPGLYVFTLAAVAAAFQRFRDPRWRLLLCLSLPSFFVFYLQPFWADYKPHWMGPAYFLLAIGVGALWSQGWSVGSRTWIRPRSRVMLWSIASFLIVLNVLFYSMLAYPWLPKAVRAFAPETKWELKNDVSNEFFGWPEVGAEVLKLQQKIEERTGKKPFLAGLRYETVAQLWKATGQRTYMLSKTVSHYTVVTTPEEYEALQGQNAIVVTTDKYPTNPLEFARFGNCEAQEFPYYRFDELARIFTIYHCHKFQGVMR